MSSPHQRVRQPVFDSANSLITTATLAITGPGLKNETCFELDDGSHRYLGSPAQAFLGVGEGLVPACPTTALGCPDSKRFAKVETEAPLLLPVTQVRNAFNFSEHLENKWENASKKTPKQNKNNLVASQPLQDLHPSG